MHILIMKSFHFPVHFSGTAQPVVFPNIFLGRLPFSDLRTFRYLIYCQVLWRLLGRGCGVEESTVVCVGGWLGGGFLHADTIKIETSQQWKLANKQANTGQNSETQQWKRANNEVDKVCWNIEFSNRAPNTKLNRESNLLGWRARERHRDSGGGNWEW